MIEQPTDARAVHPNEPRALLADALLEIIALRDEVKELRHTTQLVAEDLDTIARAVNGLGIAFSMVKQEVMRETALVAAKAFEEQLAKLEELINRTKPARRRFWNLKKEN